MRQSEAGAERGFAVRVIFLSPTCPAREMKLSSTLWGCGRIVRALRMGGVGTLSCAVAAHTIKAIALRLLRLTCRITARSRGSSETQPRIDDAAQHSSQ